MESKTKRLKLGAVRKSRPQGVPRVEPDRKSNEFGADAPKKRSSLDKPVGAEDSDDIHELLERASAMPLESREDINRILDDVMNDDVGIEQDSSQRSHNSTYRSSQQSYDSAFNSSQSMRTDSYVEESDVFCSQRTSSQESGFSGMSNSGIIKIKQEIKEEPVDFEECDVKYEFLDFDPVNESSESDTNEIDVEDETPVYPSEENVQQNDFFGAFGLIKKSDVPKEDPNESKLHRNRGGKLRRLVKPKVHDDMMLYGKVQLKNVCRDSDSQSPSAPSSRESSPRKGVSKHKAGQSSPKVSLKSRNAASIFADEENTKFAPQKTRTVRINEASSRSKEETVCSTEAPPSSKEGSKVPVVKMITALAPALHPQLMTSVARSPMRTLAKVSELEDREKKGLPVENIKKEVEEEKKTVKQNEVEPGSRRSSRLRGKQKEWKHLLRHNPDAYEKPSEIEKQQLQDGRRKRLVTKPRLPYYTYADRYRRALLRAADDQDDRDAQAYVRMYEEAIKESGTHARRHHKDWTTANRILEEQARHSKVGRLADSRQATKTIPKDLPGHYPALHGIASTLPGNRGGRSRAPLNSSQWKRNKKTGKLELISADEESQVDLTEGGIPLAELYPPPDDIDFNAKEPEPTSFIDILKAREAQQKEEEPELKDFAPVFTDPPLVEPTGDMNELSCRIPHMCAFCWVNDHMYCKNMKRNPRDLKPFGECLHFRPCEHYALRSRSQRELVEEYSALRRTHCDPHSPVNVLKLEHDPKYEVNEVDILGDNEGEGLGEDHSSVGCAPSLECEEELCLTDTEESDVPPGTELLSAELTAREHYIKFGLGTEYLPSFQKIEVAMTEQSQPPQDPYPYIARHGAEIIVASENTWYYPPRHLDFMLKKRSHVFMPSNAPENTVKSTEIKTISKEDIDEERDPKWRTVRRIAIDEIVPEGTPQPENKQKVIKVRVRKVSPKQIVIQQIMGEKNETVMRETVLRMDEELVRARDRAGVQHEGDIHPKDETKLIGDIIAREALKLVQHSGGQSRGTKGVEAGDGAEQVPTVTAEIETEDLQRHLQVEVTSAAKNKIEKMVEVPSMKNALQKLVEEKEIEKITNAVKEKFTKLYKESGGSSVDAAELTDSVNEARKILDEIKELKKKALAVARDHSVRMGPKTGSRSRANETETEKAGVKNAAPVLENKSESGLDVDIIGREGPAGRDSKDNSARVVVGKRASEGGTSVVVKKTEVENLETAEMEFFGADALGPSANPRMAYVIKRRSSKELESDNEELVDTQAGDETNREDNEERSPDSQTLTFTTKDIRKRSPALIQYIKKARLAPVIGTKLSNERRSLKNMISTVEKVIAKCEAKRSEREKICKAKQETKHWIEKMQKSVSLQIMTAVDESVQISRDQRTLEARRKELLSKLAFLQKLKTNCRNIQYEKGEISWGAEQGASEEEDIEAILTQFPVDMASVRRLAKDLDVTYPFKGATLREEAPSPGGTQSRVNSLAGTKILEAITSQLYSRDSSKDEQLDPAAVMPPKASDDTGRVPVPTTLGKEKHTQAVKPEKSSGGSEAVDQTVTPLEMPRVIPVHLEHVQVGKTKGVESIGRGQEDEKMAFARKRQRLKVTQRPSEQEVQGVPVGKIQDTSSVKMPIDVGTADPNVDQSSPSMDKECGSVQDGKHVAGVHSSVRVVNKRSLGSSSGDSGTPDLKIDQAPCGRFVKFETEKEHEISADISDAGWILTTKNSHSKHALTEDTMANTKAGQNKVKVVYPFAVSEERPKRTRPSILSRAKSLQTVRRRNGSPEAVVGERTRKSPKFSDRTSPVSICGKEGTPETLVLNVKNMGSHRFHSISSDLTQGRSSTGKMRHGAVMVKKEVSVCDAQGSRTQKTLSLGTEGGGESTPSVHLDTSAKTVPSGTVIKMGVVSHGNKSSPLTTSGHLATEQRQDESKMAAANEGGHSNVCVIDLTPKPRHGSVESDAKRSSAAKQVVVGEVSGQSLGSSRQLLKRKRASLG